MIIQYQVKNNNKKLTWVRIAVILLSHNLDDKIGSLEHPCIKGGLHHLKTDRAETLRTCDAH